MSEKKTIIITGCNGLIGTILCNALIKEYFIIGIDIVEKENPQVDVFVLGDLTTSSRVEKVLTQHQKKIYGLIHLALGMPNELDGEGMENDVEMSRVVAKMCNLCGIENVVYASSNHVTGGYEKDETFKPILRGEKESTLSEWNRISTHWQFWPDGPYACAKMCGEQIFSKLASSSDCSVSCLRIGTVLKDDQPVTTRHKCTWLSHADLIQLVSKCLSVKSIGVNKFYGVSNNQGRIWQIENAVKLLQYQPVSNAAKINK